MRGSPSVEHTSVVVNIVPFPYSYTSSFVIATKPKSSADSEKHIRFPANYSGALPMERLI